MSLLAESRSPLKMPGKELFHNGGFSHPKRDSLGSFQVKYGTRDEGESEQSSDVEINKCLDGGKKYRLAIPAVPLRCIPTSNVPPNHEKSDASHGKVDVWRKRAKDNDGDEVNSQEESWKRDSKNLAAVLVEAKEFLNAFDVSYSTLKVPLSKDFRLETKKISPLPPSSESGILQKRTLIAEPMDTIKEAKLGVESSRKRKVDEIFFGKRMIVEDRVSPVPEEKESSRPGSKCQTNEDEVCVLSPHEWNMSQLRFKQNYDGPKASNGDVHKKQVISGKGIALIDLEDNMNYVDSKFDQQIRRDVNSLLTKHCEDGFDGPLKYSFDDENEINWRIVKHEQPQGLRVMEALKLFEEQYTTLLKAKRKPTTAHTEAATRLKEEGKWISADKSFGHIPGIEIGDEFRFRVELAIVGLHAHYVSGIDYVERDGKKFATSVVDSGRYENKAKTDDVFIYSGQGDTAEDQKLKRGNLALVNSMKMGYPVRVTRKIMNPMASNACMSNERNYIYMYDGLYTAKKCLEDRDQNHKLVYKFELHRMSGQPRPRRTNGGSIKSKEVCVVNDVAQGKETILIRAMNGVDDDRPPHFIYTTNIAYPRWCGLVEPDGCYCVDGCSDSQQCPCVLKNEGEIPFNQNGAIIRAKRRVHECGPNCKCPPSCMNRVTQRGPQFQLEIFKTELRGWGLRSRNYISSGSFICEYVGELLREKEAEQRIGKDEYLFDICDDGFAVDAAMHGNIGRFINHSCSPNLYAQEVLYDHADERMPHIMFFATKNIPRLQELTYDYSYKVGRVCDANGNIKRKDCRCGSRECTGRMY